MSLVGIRLYLNRARYPRSGSIHWLGRCDQIGDKMQEVTKTVDELIESGDSPLPLEVIPNNMGINLCSVDSLSWTKRKDGQLEKLTINFLPAD